MTERKVHPIKGKHQSMSSMVAECMADPRSVRGFVIYFDEEGTMRHGHFGATRSDTAMAAAYMQMLAVEMMQQEDAE
jgi:hypothetical protein